MKKNFTLLLLISCFSFFAFAQQSKIDSLETVLKTAKDDTARFYIFHKLYWQFYNLGEFERSMNSAKEMQKIAEKINFKKELAITYNSFGVIHWAVANYDSATYFLLKAKGLFEELSDKKGIANAYNNLGLVSWNKGDYDKAIEFFFNAIKLYEELGHKDKISSAYTNIGNIHAENKDNDKALEFYFQSLKTDEEINDKNRIAQDYYNIGISYADKGESDKGFDFFIKALKMYEQLEDKFGLASSYGALGTYHANKGNDNKAIENFFKSMKIKEEIGDKQGTALTYHDIGKLYFKQNRLQEAKKQLLFSLELSKAIDSKPFVMKAYLALSACDSAQGNFKSAYEYHQLYSQIKDSIFNEESGKQITEMQTKYETEKKEQQIKLLHKDKEIQNKDLQRQKTIRNAVAGGLLLVLLFSFILVNRFILIRKQKKVIEIEREKSEKLLLNILPKETAGELKLKNAVTPKRYEQVTIMFTDFKGFTTIAEKMSAEELVSELDFIFKKFDEIISRYPIEKIKTIGDAYMCAGGLPVANTTNPMDIVLAALEIQEWMESQNKWRLRLGIHTGSVIAGVVGDKKFAYDIWGDTVNTASRMESSGEAGKVNISGTTYNLIKDKLKTTNHQLQTTFRGKIPAKNKGEIEMYFVEKK